MSKSSSSKQEKILKVIIVDDHAIVREAIQAMLEKTGEFVVIGNASDGETGLRLARNMHPDIVLMDISMPGIGGLESTRRICINSGIRVVALTASESNIFPMRFFQVGAFGYLLKSISPDELIKALHTVISGERYIADQISDKFILSHLDQNATTPFDCLSDKEFQILLMVAEGYKSKTISEKMFFAHKTVNSYRYKIFKKLGLSNDVQLTVLANQYGLINNPSIAHFLK